MLFVKIYNLFKNYQTFNLYYRLFVELKRIFETHLSGSLIHLYMYFLNGVHSEIMLSVCSNYFS